MCEDPTRHHNSLGSPKVQRSVSSCLNQFIRDRYNLDEINITGLCAKCHAFENQKMNENENMDIEDEVNRYDGSPVDDQRGENDENESEEEENGADDGSDEGSEEFGEEEEESGDDLSYESTYQQQKAMELLSNVFQMFNVDPIHDR